MYRSVVGWGWVLAGCVIGAGIVRTVQAQEQSAETIAIVPPAVRLDRQGVVRLPWREVELPGVRRVARLVCENEESAQVLRFEARAAARMVVWPLERPLAVVGKNRAHGVEIGWFWRARAKVRAAALDRKDKDDAAARLLVGFAFEPGRASVTERWRHALARKKSDMEPPGTSLCYVWAASKSEARGRVLPSPYTETVRVIVLRNGEDEDRWRHEQRDLRADYRRAFGVDPPPVVSLALMCDTDQTGGEAIARFRGVRLRVRGRAR